MLQEVKSRAGTQTQESRTREGAICLIYEHLKIILEGHIKKFLVITFGERD